MKRVAAVVLATAFVLVACGTSATSSQSGVSASPQSGQDGAVVLEGDTGSSDGAFLYSDTTSVAFIRWTENDGNLVGTFSQVRIDPQAPEGTLASDTSLTGVISDDNVSITLSQGLGTYTTLTGTLSGSTLTLAVPQAGGQLAAASLHQASVSDYNEAVAALASAGRNQAQADASASVSAQQAADAQAAQNRLDSAVAAADQAYGRSLDVLSSELEAYANTDYPFYDSLDAAATALGAVRDGYAQVRQQASSATPDCIDVAYSADDVSYQAGDVEYARSSVEYDIESVQSDLERLAAGYSDAKRALGTLEEALAANPSASAGHDQAELTPLEEHLAALQSHAKAEISSARAAAQNYVDTANGIVAKANAAADRCR